MAFTSTFLSNIPQSIFTSTGNNAITTMYFCNTGNVLAHFNVYAVPFTGNAEANTAIYFRVPLTIHDTYVMDTEKLVLEDGDSLWANVELVADMANLAVISTVSSIGI